MVRAGSSSSSSSGGGGGGEAGGGSSAGGSSAGSGRRRGRSRRRSRGSGLSTRCPSSSGGDGTSRRAECFSPMLCHCKVACTNSTISLMFGCKVGGGPARRVSSRLEPVRTPPHIPDGSRTRLSVSLASDWSVPPCTRGSARFFWISDVEHRVLLRLSPVTRFWSLCNGKFPPPPLPKDSSPAPVRLSSGNRTPLYLTCPDWPLQPPVVSPSVRRPIRGCAGCRAEL